MKNILRKNCQRLFANTMTSYALIVFLFFVTITIPLQTFAHTQLTSSIPKDRAVLTVVPKEIVLNFKKGIRLTKVAITRSGAKANKLKLDKTKTSHTNYFFALENMISGDYSVEWRGLSEDGHVMKGQFTFTVN